MAGPVLMFPPRISITRMIANISTADTEIATTDHTFGRSALPARGYGPRTPARTIVPPTRLPYAARDTTSDTGPMRAMGRAAIRRGIHARQHRELRDFVSVSTHHIRR
ncbi:hypothetical protein Scel_60360 [Streptomyces cellostaticus]|nr:hypothetical protein Scel_60360 [Streptomyces cellostaticus]